MNKVRFLVDEYKSLSEEEQEQFESYIKGRVSIKDYHRDVKLKNISETQDQIIDAVILNKIDFVN